MNTFDYNRNYKEIDFRKNPELYRIGVGEQGVLLVEPYKSEILPFWRFKTPEIAKKSAKKIYSLFLQYKKANDFPGMDMARKFLQMGYTRSRRYANHPSGKKYVRNPQKMKNAWEQKIARKKVLPQSIDWATNEKAQSARIFYSFYLKVKNDHFYQEMKRKHKLYEEKFDSMP